MRGFAYWTCAGVVAISGWAWLLPALMGVAGIGSASIFMFSQLSMFATVVPVFLAPFVPNFAKLIVLAAVQLLVMRRIWLFAVRGQRRTPESFRGLSKGLGYVGVSSFLLGLAALGLSIAIKAGSGVPAGMVFLPALFCIPWAFVLTEALSFRSPAGEPDTVSLVGQNVG
jgi:hypothetical protein